MKHFFQPRRTAIAALALGATLGLALPAQAVVSAERQALVDLYNSTNGDSWTDSTNWDTTPGSTSDPCADAWFGITCDAANEHVTRIELPSNNLTGFLPDLSGLLWLQYFDLDENHLTGSIASILGLQSLKGLRASNNQFTGSIPDLTALTLLEVFKVENNQLTGNPPAAPATLWDGWSYLCPNFLHTPAPTPADDAAWNGATGEMPWSAQCTPGYLVSTEAGAGGSIDPSRAVVTGQTTTITVTPDATHLIDTVTSTCGGALNGSTWTTAAINTDCLVSATFKAKAGAAVTSVPTLGEWALMLLAGLGLRRLPRQRG